jgi:Protein of unknown function (DUF3375)
VNQHSFEYLFDETNALKLLRDKRAALVLTFLKFAFQDDRKSIGQDEMVRLLTEYLRRYDEAEIFDDTELTEPDADLFDRYRSKAKSLLRDWEDIKKRYLRGDNNAEGQYEYFLTEHVVRAWQWLEGLQKKEFTGTRSRLNDIFEKLNRVVENGREKTDQERIQAIEAQQRALQLEIELIQTGRSQYKPLTRIEVTEEYDSLLEQIRALSTDFKAVEGRFERIRAEILRKQAVSEESRGQLLHQALDARDDLDSTPQGQSFNGFFEELRNPARQEEYQSRIDALIQLLQHHGLLIENENTLRRLYRNLLGEAQPVLEANRRIVDRIRRFVSEQNRENKQLLRQRIAEVKAAFLDKEVQKRIKHHQTVWELDSDEANIKLPLEKTLKTQAQEAKDRFALPKNATEKAPPIAMTDDGDLSLRVEQTLKETLEHIPEIALKDLAQLHALQDGLAEVIAYLNLVSKNQEKHHISIEKTETILLDAATQTGLQGPDVVFRK